MKKLLTILGSGILLSATVSAQTPTHAPRCGIQQEKAALIAKDPTWAQRFEAQRKSLQGIADNYKLQQKNGATEKTTSLTPIPVIFHIIVDSAEFNQMGGSTGIANRVDSQIAVIERDYNRSNGDSTRIPSGWKPLFAAVGIHFGLAHTDPNGHGTPGYEIKISSHAFTQGTYGDYSDAKDNTYGLAAWDVTKYINVWCINFSDGSGLLGITTPKSFTGGWGGEPVNYEGVCINYLTLGKRTSASDHYLATGYGSNYYDLGRTLTHELGHFFEIWHTWGDDGGLCPWSSGGSDDGLSDTPPEDDAKYGAYPDTMVASGGSYTDACLDSSSIDVQPIGISSHDYMNYTDDIAMQMFTNDQAAVMISQVSAGGENVTLTGNPTLTSYPLAVTKVEVDNDLNIFPNPSTGVVNISMNNVNNNLQEITIFNITGQQVMNVKGSNQDYYSIDLSGMSKGIYFVKCNFASGSVTRKISLQ